MQTADANRIRIAYIVHGFDVGGIERCVAHLANHLDRSQFQPMIVSLTRNGTAADWIENDDVPVVEIQKRNGNDPSAVLRLARQFKQHNVDVVHSHNWGTLVETAVARRWAGVTGHVHTEHGQGLHVGVGGLKQQLRRRATYWAFDRADAVLICAESVKSLVAVRSGFPESRLQFLPNGVDDPLEQPVRFAPAELRSQLGIPTDAFVVGSVGRLVDVKDFPTAVSAVAAIPDQSRPVHLVIVGDGPNRQPLQELVADLNVGDRVHLVGWHADVADWLRLFDTYLNCSRSEAMSMGILEAMAAELPLIVTDVGDNPLLAGGESPCGLIVDAENPGQMAAAIEQLASDPQMQEAFSKQAVDRYRRRFSTERMVKEHAALYRRASGGALGEQHDSELRQQTTPEGAASCLH